MARVLGDQMAAIILKYSPQIILVMLSHWMLLKYPRIFNFFTLFTLRDCSNMLQQIVTVIIQILFQFFTKFSTFYSLFVCFCLPFYHGYNGSSIDKVFYLNFKVLKNFYAQLLVMTFLLLHLHFPVDYRSNTHIYFFINSESVCCI